MGVAHPAWNKEHSDGHPDLSRPGVSSTSLSVTVGSIPRHYHIFLQSQNGCSEGTFLLLPRAAQQNHWEAGKKIPMNTWDHSKPLT